MLELHNLDHKPMQLVLFEDALGHLIRIHRILRMPLGNALLIGVGGSGKQSLVNLAAYCAGQSVFTITLIRGYGEEMFREDLKELYKQLSTREVVFLFTDAHVADEGFLESINNMLTTGMVPGLYEQDEKDQAINSVRKEVKAANIAETPDNCWNYYVSKCRKNMHIVLAMSPSGNKLQVRCRSFPGLISGCVIDWFFPWPEDALTKVAQYFLAETPLPEDKRAAVVAHLTYSYLEVNKLKDRFATELRRYYYITPKNYLDFISNYKKQLDLNENKINRDVKRLEGGLTKLIEAAAAVDRMQIDLTEKKVVVDANQVEVNGLIENITAKKGIADAAQAEAEVKQAHAVKQAEEIDTEKAKADKALEAALPAVEAAEKALENLQKKDLDEIKNFANPPLQVKNACFCVTILRPTGEKLDETWPDAKKMLSNSNLLNLLKAYPKDSITEKQVRSVRKYFKDKEFTHENLSRVSQAGTGLFVWVTAILNYHDVAKEVEPLKLKVKEMEKAQIKTTKELAALDVKLKGLAEELAELNEGFEKANEKLTALVTEADIMDKR